MDHEIIKNQTGLSNAEKEINQYVLSNLDNVKNMSIRKLAKETYTTPTTVMRYCKKLGYGGFEEFKINIQNDLKDLNYDDFMLKDSENTIHIVNKMKALYDDVVDKTLQMLSVSQMERILAKLDQVRYVDFIVYDANKAFAEYASHYLFLTGKICNIYTSIDEQILFAMNAEPKDHLAIIISRNGSSKRLVKVTKELYAREIYTILFTKTYATTVSKYCTETISALYSSNFEQMGDSIFYTSVKYLLDCMIGIYYTQHYDQTLEKVENYRQRFLGIESKTKL